MRLDGKVAVVTGAAGDIGLATARRFRKEGASVFLVDRNENGLNAVKASLDGNAETFVADVADEQSIETAAQAAASAFGKIDILFANAGVEQSYVPITDHAASDFQRVININLVGAFLTAKHMIAYMADGGSVMFTSSIAALMPFPAYSAYSSSKTALIGLMRSVSLDVAPRGIRCNTIHPGPVRSKMLVRSATEATGGGDVEEWFSAMAKNARLGKLVTPDDVAGLALFLASDDSKMITGQKITVDGGVVH